MTRNKPRILVIDVETSPMILTGFSLWDQNFGINQIISPSHVMCFAYKWHGDSRVKFHSTWDDGAEDQAKLLHKLFDEADIVVGYNSQKFDAKHVNREIMLTAKLPSPSRYEHIDLLTQWKKSIATPSNKLAYVTQVTGYETKLSHEGMPLWLDCLGQGRFEKTQVSEEEISAARKKMRLYNMQDVKITDSLFMFLRDQGWLKSTPNLAAYSEKDLACKVCGEDDQNMLQSRGSKATKAGVWRYGFYCLSCNSYFTGAVDKEIHRPALKAVGS